MDLFSLKMLTIKEKKSHFINRSDTKNSFGKGFCAAQIDTKHLLTNFFFFKSERELCGNKRANLFFSIVRENKIS